MSYQTVLQKHNLSLDPAPLLVVEAISVLTQQLAAANSTLVSVKYRSIS